MIVRSRGMLTPMAAWSVCFASSSIATGLAALGTSPALLGDAWPYRRGGQDAREFYPSTNRRFVKPPLEHESSVCARQQPKIGTDVPVQFRMVRRVVCTRCYPTWCWRLFGGDTDR